MDQGERNVTEKETILDRRDQPFASLDEVVDACLPRLTARVWRTCRWPRPIDPGWKIGDYNYLVLSVAPDEESSLFVQYWSEPHEPVCAEVCSGEWNPGAVKYLRQQQRKRIEALGYEIGGRARNYTKEIRVESAADAEGVAREALGIFFDLFGYRGQWPLEAEWHEGERAEHEAVHFAVTPQDVEKLAAGLGFEVAGRSEEEPLIALRHGRKRFVAALHARVPDNNLYAIVILQALVRSRTPIDDAVLLWINEHVPFGKVSRHSDRELALSLPLRLDGGVTSRWIELGFKHWVNSWRACQRWVKKAQAPAGGGPSRGTRSEDALVH